MPRLRRIGLPLLLAMAAMIGGSGLPPAARGGAADRLPDLRMAPLTQFRTEFSGGQRRVRFSTIMTNEGAGPLEVRGWRNNLSEQHLQTQQRIYNTAGGSRLAASRALMEYARDGHDHWHIQGVMLYQLWADSGLVRRGAKVGFCFLDSTAWRLSLPGAPQLPRYFMSSCGDTGDLQNRMGLSVGWGDHYPANFAFQWIDITGLPPGDYTVQAKADEQNWYLESNETNNCAWARVRVQAGNGPLSVLSSGRTCLAPPASTARVERQYGDDRYQTAAAVSEDAFAAGVPVAYVATGANFPDALAAGAAAGFKGGPVVLVEKFKLPALAVTELERLNPQRIVIVGGTGVISQYVASLVARFHTGGGATRIAGSDRYATAATISAATFAGGTVDTAYVASGRDWADALAAVPHAARSGGPVLLTLPTEVPGRLQQELIRLRPHRIIVVGGPGVVSDGVLAALDAFDTGGGVLRIGGADRYATAAALSAFHFPGGATFAYVATGANFPDALAAGPAAAIRGAATLLVRAPAIPPSTATELARLNPGRIYVLGGPNVISGAVQAQLGTYVGP